MGEVQLKVGDARQRDVARGIARIDQRAMQKLGISAGGVIEIFGKRATTAIASPAYSEDQDRGIIRIDGLTRKNAGVAINEYAIVRPAEVKDAIAIVLAPVDMRLNVDKDFIKFVKIKKLMGRVFVEGDTIIVKMLWHAIPFTVIKTQPFGVVRMTNETNLQILSEPGIEPLDKLKISISVLERRFAGEKLLARCNVQLKYSDRVVEDFLLIPMEKPLMYRRVMSKIQKLAQERLEQEKQKWREKSEDLRNLKKNLQGILKEVMDYLWSKSEELEKGTN